MTRAIRIQYASALYHVFTRGIFQQPLFLGEPDYDNFISLLSITQVRYNFRIFSYCLMPNHYHLQIATPDANLALGMQYLNGVYAMGFNDRNERYGHVMQGRYNYCLIEHETYFCTVARYIALNPIQAALVEQPSEWGYSSYRAITGLDDSPNFLDKEGLLGFFGDSPLDTPRGFLEFMGRASEEDLEFDQDLVLLRPTLNSLFSSANRDQAIAEAVFKWKYTSIAIANHLGLSKSQVHRIAQGGK